MCCEDCVHKQNCNELIKCVCVFECSNCDYCSEPNMQIHPSFPICAAANCAKYEYKIGYYSTESFSSNISS